MPIGSRVFAFVISYLTNLYKPTSSYLFFACMNSSTRKPEKELCPVCLENLKHPCAMSDCQHSFCFDCITEWCKLNASCPLCKEPIKWLLNESGELHAIETPPPQEYEPDPLFIVSSSEDSMADFIVPDDASSEEDVEWRQSRVNPRRHTTHEDRQRRTHSKRQKR